MSTMRDKGFEAIKQAVALDNAGDHEHAIPMYTKGLEYITVHMKHEKNQKAKEMIASKVEQYMTRVELLKGLQQGGTPGGGTPPARQGGGAAQKMKPKPGNDAGGGAAIDDEEKDKMRKALMDAITIGDSGMTFDDVAGLELAKTALKEAAIKPTLYPQLFTGKRKPWKGILMYGPPGTGKSYLAKALAGEAKCTFFSVSSADLVSKYVGDSSKLVRTLFEMAREKKPSIIFVDEIDSLCTARGDGESESARQIKTEFLVQMDGVGHDMTGVLTIGATNLPWAIDQAVRRRMQKRIYIPLPEERARAALIKVALKSHENKDLSEEDYAELARRTEGFSGSDISIMIGEALMDPIRMMDIATHFKQVTAKNKDGQLTAGMWMMCSPGDPTAQRMKMEDIDPAMLADPTVTMMNFLAVVDSSRASVSPEELGPFQDWTAQFGQDGSGASGQLGDNPSLLSATSSSRAVDGNADTIIAEGMPPGGDAAAGGGGGTGTGTTKGFINAITQLTAALPDSLRVAQLEARMAAMEQEMSMLRAAAAAGRGGGA